MVNINDLSVMPLHYASSQVKNQIQERGRKLWSVLNGYEASHINYRGWTVENDEYFVRNMIFCLSEGPPLTKSSTTYDL